MCRENSVAGYGIPFLYGWVAGLPGPLISVGGTPSMAPHQSLRPASHRPLFEGTRKPLCRSARLSARTGHRVLQWRSPPGPQAGIGDWMAKYRAPKPGAADRGTRSSTDLSAYQLLFTTAEFRAPTATFCRAVWALSAEAAPRRARLAAAPIGRRRSRSEQSRGSATTVGTICVRTPKPQTLRGA